MRTHRIGDRLLRARQVEDAIQSLFVLACAHLKKWPDGSFDFGGMLTLRLKFKKLTGGCFRYDPVTDGIPIKYVPLKGGFMGMKVFVTKKFKDMLN